MRICSKKLTISRRLYHQSNDILNSNFEKNIGEYFAHLQTQTSSIENHMTSITENSLSLSELRNLFEVKKHDEANCFNE
jgi:hypothetical protein